MLNTVASKNVKVCGYLVQQAYPIVLTLPALIAGRFISLIPNAAAPQVLVVGNPANTNCLIASECAPNIPKGAAREEQAAFPHEQPCPLLRSRAHAFARAYAGRALTPGRGG